MARHAVIDHHRLSKSTIPAEETLVQPEAVRDPAVTQKLLDGVIPASYKLLKAQAAAEQAEAHPRPVERS